MSTGKMVSSKPLLEFKVRGCKILGADDIRDEFDKVHLGLLCCGLPADVSPEGETGGTFSCSAEEAAGERRQTKILIPSTITLVHNVHCVSVYLGQVTQMTCSPTQWRVI